MPKLQEFPLVVIRSKKVAFFESVVCLMKVVRRHRSYIREMEWNYFAECPKLFLYLIFFGKHFFLRKCFWPRTMQVHQTCQKILRKTWKFPDRIQNYQTKKHSSGKAPSAINSLNKWNNFLLTVPEVILRNTKIFQSKIENEFKTFIFPIHYLFSSNNVSRRVERNLDNDFGLFLDLCRKLFT